MSVTREEVFRMARLARLALDEEEADGLLEDLNQILEHMESLGEVRTEPPEDADDAHRKGPVRLRDGREEEPDRLVRDPAHTAPAWKDGFFVVPRLPAVEGAEEEPEERAP